MNPLVIIVGVEGKGERELLESIEGHAFKDKDEVLKECRKLFGKGCFSICSMTDFMDSYNDETLVVADTFFGYVCVK